MAQAVIISPQLYKRVERKKKWEKSLLWIIR